MERVLLFLKGVCMGLSDIIPGVSGGTMALILGIYRQFIDALKSLNIRWVAPLVRWLVGGRKEVDWAAFIEELERMDLRFLATLGAGIGVAVLVGSMIIPTLLEQYPVQMRAFFFGLILASVWVPYKMIDVDKSAAAIAAVLLAAVLGAGFGYLATDPGRTLDVSRTWTEVESTGESLKDLARRAPSAATSDHIYWAPQNEGLRQAVAADDPEFAQRLRDSWEGIDADAPADKATLKARAEPYQDVFVPEDVAVQVPRPAYWYVFGAGMIAISAMLLPGISGSYILLILGVYFFVLNALKGSISTLVAGGIPLSQGGFVLLFMLGMGIGLLSFARVLSYLLHRFPAVTLSVLVGLMLGCLRGIWPFRSTVDGQVINVMPEAFSPLVLSALATLVVGVIIVGALTWLGARRQELKD
jgi:putative membrane protein